ncbi:unnamed protein product [Ceutorhynchus assimilis]|uniref:DUF4806 domain-containing protein n=1 Tax=Ceutorhynchus assimilis TaxID=467358 RepID=A0A9N9QC80_9CUCU|nr:unnamed protein product [Ceutorhynchus assimilis]
MVEILEIKYEVQETKKILERVETLLANKAIANIPNENVNKYMEKIPCKTKTDVDRLDSEIRVNDNFKYLVKILYLLGGSSPRKSVYLMMGKILDKPLALEYSGQGKKKKIPFCKLKLFEAIIAAVRKRHSSASEDTIKKSVALFLASAKSRLPKNENQREIEEDESELE